MSETVRHRLSGDGADRAEQGERRPGEAHRCGSPILPAMVLARTLWLELGSANALDQFGFKRAGWIEPDAARRSQQERERGLARLLHFQRKQRVRPGSAKVDRGHRFSEAGRPLDEAEARIDHERRADDQHGVGFVQMAEGGVDPVARNVLAEEHDVGLEHAAAAAAGRNNEGRKVRAFEVRVAVGRFRCVKIEPVAGSAG